LKLKRELKFQQSLGSGGHKINGVQKMALYTYIYTNDKEKMVPAGFENLREQRWKEKLIE
jgi:hypothetical protein